MTADMGVFRQMKRMKACSLECMTAIVNQICITKVYERLRVPLPWLLPPRCVVCGYPGPSGRDLCTACHAALPWLSAACRQCALQLPLDDDGLCGICQHEPPPLDAVHAAFDYAFPLDRLLPRLKFHRDFAAGRVLTQCMAERFAALPRPSLLVPLPLHRKRLRARGFNQALELARPLAKALDIPLNTQLLQRHKSTAAQSTLNADARLRNVCDAFSVNVRAPIPESVVLFDDVMTTGASLHAAADTLREAGVRHVEAWVCARAA